MKNFKFLILISFRPCARIQLGLFTDQIQRFFLDPLDLDLVIFWI